MTLLNEHEALLKSLIVQPVEVDDEKPVSIWLWISKGREREVLGFGETALEARNMALLYMLEQFQEEEANNKRPISVDEWTSNAMGGFAMMISASCSMLDEFLGPMILEDLNDRFDALIERWNAT